MTSGGKKIAPQPIEGVLKASPLVAEAVLLGDRRKYPAVLIVPDFAALERRLRAWGVRPPSREELPGRADVRGLYQELVDALNRELSLSSSASSGSRSCRGSSRSSRASSRRR